MHDVGVRGHLDLPQRHRDPETVVGPLIHPEHEKKVFDYIRIGREEGAKLELDLTEAIKSERYEDAARTRDEINQVKQAFHQQAQR